MGDSHIATGFWEDLSHEICSMVEASTANTFKGFEKGFSSNLQEFLNLLCTSRRSFDIYWDMRPSEYLKNSRVF